MNFFEYQDRARRNSTLLLILFITAVIGLVVITTLFVALLAGYSDLRNPAIDTSLATMLANLGWSTVAGIAISISAIICVASLFRLRQLSGGGRTIAESLGGHKINTTPNSLAEQRALNVVEEMALASGTPVPDVYILEDDAINAFAAGYAPGDAVIGLTRGCIEQLSRDELQGVVAHEFSHIFNGDMRLNIRIVGLLYGILIIGLLGSWMLRGSYWSGGRNNRGRAVLFGIGAGLVAIGYTGTFFGSLIKSAVSRQREYLADASAVQFTRNSQGIAGALKKISQHTGGSQLQAANASEFSHMYFASSLKHSLLGLFATHPPLNARITRLDPQWRGQTAGQVNQQPNTSESAFSPVRKAGDSPLAQMHDDHTAGPGANAARESFKARLDQVIEVVDNNIAQPTHQQHALGQSLLASIPASLKAAAHDPFSARALVYAVLIAGTKDNEIEHRKTQVTLLDRIAHPAVLREFRKIETALASTPLACRLPLIDLCIPALKSLAPQQFQVFKRNVIKLLRADGKVEIREWALYRVLMHGLENKPDQHRSVRGRKSQGSAINDAQQFLLATMAHADCGEYLAAKRAFEAGARTLGLTPAPLPAQSDITLQRLDKAVAIARDTSPLQKPRLLKALATTLAHDGVIGGEEVELLRAIADCLDCPMPPIPGTPTTGSAEKPIPQEATTS